MTKREPSTSTLMAELSRGEPLTAWRPEVLNFAPADRPFGPPERERQRERRRAAESAARAAQRAALKQ